MGSVELQENINSCENYIKVRGIDQKIVDAYFTVAKMAVIEQDDKMLHITSRAKWVLEKFVHDTTGLTMWEIEKKYFSQDVQVEILETWYEIIKMEAQNKHVDSYFRYIERKRVPKERFYEPRRKQFLKMGLMTALQGMINDKYDILCISLVPGAGKTTIEKFFNSAVIGWYPKDYTLFYSHSGDITRMYYDGVYDIVTNQDEYTWNEIFPDLKVTSTNAKLEQFNIGKYKPFPSLQCTSVGSKNAGKVRASKFLLVDDMIGGIEEALNKAMLEKLWNKYAVDARQRKVQDTEGKPCKEIHIATRWSTVDVIGRIQAMYADNPRVKVISVPDIDPETGESNFDYEHGGFTKEFFADQELLMDDISYKCLYKQQPIEREGLLYHEEELRRYMSLPLREPDAILGICDVKNKGTDFMFLPCMYQYDNDYYLVDCICDDNADYGIQYGRLTSLILEHNMQQCEFESNNGGDRVSYEVSKRVAAAGGRCNITEKATETNKETRIIVNADWVKKHVLFKDKSLYKAKSDYGIMMEWLLRYSLVGKNPHDDVPDGLANFALYVNPRYEKRETKIIQGYL